MPSTTEAPPAAGIELRPLEVCINLEMLADTIAYPSGVCLECGGPAECDNFNEAELVHGRLLEELRRQGIELGRPFTLHIDAPTRCAIAKQDPWRGE